VRFWWHDGQKNTSLKVDFQGSRGTSDGGLILVRELDERLGFGDLIAHHLSDSAREEHPTCTFNPWPSEFGPFSPLSARYGREKR